MPVNQRESAEDRAIKLALQQREAENFEELHNAAKKIVRTELENGNEPMEIFRIIF